MSVTISLTPYEGAPSVFSHMKFFHLMISIGETRYCNFIIEKIPGAIIQQGDHIQVQTYKFSTSSTGKHSIKMDTAMVFVEDATLAEYISRVCS